MKVYPLFGRVLVRFLDGTGKRGRLHLPHPDRGLCARVVAVSGGDWARHSESATGRGAFDWAWSTRHTSVLVASQVRPGDTVLTNPHTVRHAYVGGCAIVDEWELLAVVTGWKEGRIE